MQIDPNQGKAAISPAALAAINSELKNLYLSPPPTPIDLEQRIAERYGVDQASVVVGSGVTDLLNLLSIVQSCEDASVVFSSPGFGLYAHLAELYGYRARSVPVSGYNHDVQGIISAIDRTTRIVFLDSPHYITGRSLSTSDLTRIAQALPDSAALVHDNVYGDFGNAVSFRQAVELAVDPTKTVVLCRTFSKAHCLLGIRVGYAITNANMAAALRRYRMPYGVNRLAQVAALASLEDVASYTRNVSLNALAKQEIYGFLDARGIDYSPTDSNFLLLNFKNRIDQAEAYLTAQGVKFRNSKKCGMPNHLQIHLIDPTVTRDFMQAIDALYSE